MAKNNNEYVVRQKLCLRKYNSTVNTNSKNVESGFMPVQNKGITLVALAVTVIILLMISTVGIYTSLDRFELNNYKKMKTDLELLEDKVSNYYLKYEGLPLLRDTNSAPISFDYKTYLSNLTNKNQEPETNANDNDIYYIIDLEALGNITLNYGKDFEKYKSNNVVQNVDTDIYIINEESHTIYYVKGINMDGVTYHYIKKDEQISDNVPPTAPQISIIVQTLARFEFEIIPGKDGWTGTTVTYLLNGKENSYQIGKRISITTDGTYSLQAVCKDKENNESKSEVVNFTIKKLKIGDFIQYDVAYNDVYNTTYKYTKNNGWRIISFTENTDRNIF